MTVSDPASFPQPAVPFAAPQIDRFEDIGLGSALSELRTVARGPSPVVVGIIDGPVATGIPAFHDADLQVAPAHENRPAASGAATRHGTHIASILFARDGLIPQCRGLLAPVVGERDDGAIVPADQFMLARAIEMLVEAGANIINVSAGQRVAYPDADAVLHKALALCAERDVLIVAAAGNDGCACADIPAALPPVLAVGSHDSDGRPSKFSNFADAYAGSGLLAPGESIWGLDPLGVEVAANGTSYSAAIVSGVAALLMSACAARGRAIGGRAILDALRKTARACAPGDADGATCLAGRLDVAAAMSELELEFDLGRAGARPVFLSGRRGTMSVEGVAEITLQGVPGTAAAALAAAPPIPRVEPKAVQEGLSPSDCGCGCGGAKAESKGEEKPACNCGGGRQAAPQLAYALGTLDVDFGTEAGRDVFLQSMPADRNNPSDPAQLSEFLDANPVFEQGLNWVLRLDASPIYVIRPGGTYAESTAAKLRSIYKSYASGDPIELVSIPGIMHGRARLMSGQELPVIYPDLRGIFAWNVSSLATFAAAGLTAAGTGGTAATLENFLNRVYFEFRNLGVLPKDRALNYAATNAFQVSQVFGKALASSMALDGIRIEKSPICRPESDCWDVVLTFFKPEDKYEKARMNYRFTVDVSEVLPILVGPVRSWAIY